MRKLWRTLTEIGTDDPGLSERDAKHIRVTNTAALMLAPANLWWVPVNLSAGVYWNAAQNLAMGLGVLTTLLLQRRGRHGAAALLVLACSHVQLLWAMWWFGTASGTAAFFPALMVASYTLCMRRHRPWAHASAALVAVEMVAVAIFADDLPTRIELMPVRQQEISNTAAAAALLAILGVSFSATVDRSEEALMLAHDRADALLRNVLPSSIAERLKASPNRRIAERFDAVTVLFADLVGFTPMSARVAPEEMVDMLNDIFRAFDEICDREGVEKIRTIGDGYMAVAGAPERRDDHALAMTRVAIGIRDYMSSRGDHAGAHLAIRVGLNSGEVVAGVVGKSRFHYDIWGDTVNIAARMESHGEAGHIQLARSTWEAVREHVPCTPRGTIDVKGKGPMETWFVD